uniref:NADH dehydrogenase subunit 6 n=1 Tax=Ciconiphilus decimfasciatus TaxID=2212705 RepID=UPI00257D8F84|nr:NADH dehydrogenase subunit 6 [Ciconiphilus decimfasciatus]WGW14987.1 NADH dehydrogenase subunit 6 [Ciconiphilus decimfasciatus]
MMNIYSEWIYLILVLMFFLSKNLINSLCLLMVFTFLGSFISFWSTRNFWVLGLMMIVMITGLFLIFAYIVSVNPSFPSVMLISKKLFWFMLPSFFFMYTCFFFKPKHLSANYIWSMKEMTISSFFFSNIYISSFLIVLLLILVIFFVRFTHSKGGGLRKKFYVKKFNI